MKITVLYFVALAAFLFFVPAADAQYPDCGQVCTVTTPCETECAADPGKGEGEATTCAEYGICDGCVFTALTVATAADASARGGEEAVSPDVATATSDRLEPRDDLPGHAVQIFVEAEPEARQRATGLQVLDHP